jgi:chromate reductase
MAATLFRESFATEPSMPDKLNVLALCGSLRRESLNRAALRAAEALAPDAGLAIDVASIADVPPCDEDVYAKGFPPSVERLRGQIRAADALLFVTPEYNYSMPGVLKNAIDWGSRPWGKNSWTGKPGAVLGTSPGAIGTAIAQQHLRTVMAYLDVALLGQPEMFIKHDASKINEKGAIISDDMRKFLQSFVDRYTAWVQHQLGR